MWYDIKYITAKDKYQTFGTPMETKLVFKYQKTSAKSAAEALDTFGTRKMLEINREQETWDIANKPVAIPLKHEWDTRDKNYWFEKWQYALAAMPFKVRTNWTTNWIPQRKGETALPDFIKGRAKGKMKIVDGTVCVMVTLPHSTTEYGRIAALAIILGYITTDGKDTKRPRANCCALQGRKIPESSRPRSPKVRQLLAELGTMPKDEIKALLQRKREAMKHGK